MASAWKLIGVLAGAMLAAASCGAVAQAEELSDLPVLASQGGVLDIVMVARTQPIHRFGTPTPKGWVFSICARTTADQQDCPTSPDNLYGGTRLALQPGDTLKVRLVNKLPPVLDSEWATVPHHSWLALNPVNLHTHGMLVSPRAPTVDDPTYGDNVFVMTLNAANGPIPPDAMLHTDVKTGYTDYRIHVPAHHPEGLYWFHPHIHGISVNQMSAGLSGVITIGKVTDYVSGAQGMPVRHIMLKDSQIAADGHLVDEAFALFCPPAPHAAEPVWQGSCPGSKDGRGGRWFFTLNGQPYPTATVAPSGEIWRITQASASVAYDLAFAIPAQKRDMVVQVLAVDGVAVRLPKPARPGELAMVGGAKFAPTPCPSDLQGPAGGGAPLCVARLLMLPSSRVELYVAYRDKDGALAAATSDPVILRTYGRVTGPTGDSWPALDLASVVFTGGAPSPSRRQTLAVRDDARALRDPQALARDLRAENAAAGSDKFCSPLAPGHRRRIFFNLIKAAAGEEQPFGLGYEETDAQGVPVPGTFQQVESFNPDKPTICLPLGPGVTPVHETWELVNLAGEDHNFHLHQVKFSLAAQDAITGDIVPADGVLHDNVPVQHADGLCQSVDKWRKGKCLTHPVLVDIPFTIAGDYVYHCHILEHEDGGMMAVIRVRNPDAGS